ncbi:MAG TPA: hypothetical protein DDY91_19300 [Planctomycetaceae bacterium]|jgi:hypothetical protein|nr:hypothetical protein [Planctomycetaceae bacterium]
MTHCPAPGSRLPIIIVPPVPEEVVMEPLLQRRATLLAEIAALSPATAGGKPSYHIDGQQVDHTAYRLSLYRELELIERLLSGCQPPTEQVERGAT